MTEDTLFLLGLSPVDGLDIHARFDGGSLSSDGGVLVLREIEQGLKFADTLAACLHDKRDPTRILHGHATMIRSRIFAIACGYEDCDDHDELRHDPAFKMACERLPDTGHALASKLPPENPGRFKAELACIAPYAMQDDGNVCASLWSVLFGMVFIAASACRVSMQMASLGR